jgi:hypothetical protein
MSDDFEDLLKRWLRDRARSDRAALQALAGNVAALPPRRREPGRLLPLVASVAVVVGLLLVVAPRFGSVGNDASPTPSPTPRSPGIVLPGGPDAYAGDPRLGRCFGVPEDMEFVFEMAHARDYRRYVPRMGTSPELDTDAAAFAVVYGDGWAGPMITGAAGAKPQTPEPGRRFVCVLVAGADPILYGDVDITGLTVDVVPSSPMPSGSPEPPPSATSSLTTPEPAPAWVSDLAGQLQCDGVVANLGGEYPETGSPEDFGDTAAAALATFLGPSNPYASLPTAGFALLHEEPHWASFGHLVDGRPKAIILLTDTTEYGPGWSVVGLRACDASEFDPNVPLTFPVTIWTDASGERVSTETIRSAPGPGHCGWDSAIWLNVDGNLYFRDPQGVMAEWTKTRFEPDAKLPASALDSGYRSAAGSLWLDPGKDAYLVLPGGVERWPRSTDPFIGCA